LTPSLDELERVSELLTGAGHSYQIDFTSGRGFEYYTGTIFGFHCAGRGVGGGGKYDELIPLVGGQRVCASGFALYIDELMDLVEDAPERDRILLRAKDDDGLGYSLTVARRLREAGHIVELDLGLEKTSGFRWIVDLRGGDGMEVVKTKRRDKRRVSSVEELLEMVGGAACE
jgi:histidyl-tRNA synthetase